MNAALFIKQTSLGDVLHITPALRAFKKKFPGAHVAVITDQVCKPVLSGNPHVDTIHTVRWASLPNRLWYQIPFFIVQEMVHSLILRNILRRTSWDGIIDFQGLSKSAFFIYTLPARYKIAHKPLPLIRHVPKRSTHVIDMYLDLLRPLTINDDGWHMDYFVQPHEAEEASEWLDNRDLRPGMHRLLMISPFTRWKTKNYPLPRYEQVIQSFIKQDAERHRVIVSVAKEDVPKIQTWKTLPNTHIATGSIRQMAALLNRMDILLSGDSFPMHLAGALSVPQVALFGPTDVVRVGPVNRARHAVIQSGKLSCLGCKKRTCSHHTCLQSIESDYVVQQIGQVLYGETLGVSAGKIS